MKPVFWVETRSWKKVAPPRGERGLKLSIVLNAASVSKVAPPRGERGLKLPFFIKFISIFCRSPSWGAWIETEVWESSSRKAGVAPPRGERGLKPFDSYIIIPYRWVAPPRGERGLKQASKRMGSRKK